MVNNTTGMNSKERNALKKLRAQALADYEEQRRQVVAEAFGPVSDDLLVEQDVTKGSEAKPQVKPQAKPQVNNIEYDEDIRARVVAEAFGPALDKMLRKDTDNGTDGWPKIGLPLKLPKVQSLQDLDILKTIKRIVTNVNVEYLPTQSFKNQ